MVESSIHMSIKYRIKSLLLDDELMLYSSMGLVKLYNLVLYIAVFMMVFIFTIYVLYGKFLNGIYALIFLVSSTPAVVFLSIHLYKLNIKHSLSLNLTHEKPLIYLLMAIYAVKQSLERTIYTILKSPSSRYMKGISSIFRHWLIKYYIVGSSIDDVIWQNINVICEPDLRKYFRELIRVSWVGGDLIGFLKSKLVEYYSLIRELWSEAWKNISGYLEVIILIFGLTPSILSSLVFLLGYRLTIYVFTVMLLIFPIIGSMSYVMIERNNPRLPIPSKLNIKYLFPLSFIPISTAVLSIFLHIDYPRSILYSLAILMTPNFISNIINVKKESEIEHDLLTLLRELEELVKGGFSVLEAIKNIDLNRYSKPLKSELQSIIVRYESGVDIREHPESRYPFITFFKIVLGEILYSGGGLEEVIELRDLLESYSKVNKMRRVSSLIPLATSVGVLFLGGYSTWVIEKILSRISTGTILRLLGSEFNITSLSIYSRLFLVIGSTYTGLLIDKTVFGDIWKTIGLYILTISLSLLFMLIPI